MNTDEYYRPFATHREAIVVSNSRFITTIALATTVDTTKQILAKIRSEMPDASHHVYAFRVGYGNTVIEGMSDDGEPSGTGGPPTLAVVRGSELGDIILITTRYFGGIKLGTGGLVRAYTKAAKNALNTLKIEQRTVKVILGIEVPYHLYNPVKSLIGQYHAQIDEETFAAEITILVNIAEKHFLAFSDRISEISAGSIKPILLEILK